ncbi:MAG: efflux RND transporter periplasmic adaptor subunit [Candidatus Dadabacteria bacterium]|nr:efflux RND transporter periplasmic adaptor subunit [Candidatus Dadabacteria bacterium]NIV41942.1 efflux RND transporter periplasmic adaptor subunit [Candidatus Dadabacteria bacterium]NIX14678.1 efflux RND transporter periplasmic adaptor subunit [Candidatus Dadabacteria bacterium]
MNIQNLSENKYRLTAIVILVIALFMLMGKDDDKPSFKTSKVQVGDIKSYIQATGKIEPTRKAEISAEVTGIVNEVYVDYNSKVKKDQILATIDPTDFELKFSEAKANFAKANADFELSRNIYSSNKTLYNKNLISSEELKNSKVQYSSALASREQAQVNLEQAKTDLANTKLQSPIEGSIIGKNIVEGQSVSKNKLGPPLFTVANNLDKMVVIASVNEIDIGKVKEGNNCEFTTDAYPGEKYSGQITQIISEPITVNNLVSYDVLIEFENTDKKLKPGMTASVEILVGSKNNVLIADRSALRFIPPSNEYIVNNAKYSQDDEVLWVKARGGKLKPVIITTGTKNDTHVEITGGEIKKDDEIVVLAVFGSKSDDSSGQISVPGVKRF